jgi:hypothetical protein
MKRTWFQAQIKQDIAISKQNEYERHSTHKSGSYSIFTKESHPQAYISQSYQEHSYTSHEHHKQGHNLISSISWWVEHIRKAHLHDMCYTCSLRYKDANMIWYKNEGATCICTSTLPTEDQKGKTTPSTPHKRANVAWSKGLVRISASCFSVGTWMRSMFLFSTLSLRKWYLTSICLVLEWKHGVFGNTNGTRAITHERYIGTLTKITQRVCDPKQLGTTTSGSNIFGFCGRLSYTRLPARRPRNKRRTQKLTSPRSQLPIDSTPRKVGIRKTKKRKGRGRRVPKTELRSV